MNINKSTPQENKNEEKPLNKDFIEDSKTYDVMSNLISYQGNEIRVLHTPDWQKLTDPKPGADARLSATQASVGKTA